MRKERMKTARKKMGPAHHDTHATEKKLLLRRGAQNFDVFADVPAGLAHA